MTTTQCLRFSFCKNPVLSRNVCLLNTHYSLPLREGWGGLSYLLIGPGRWGSSDPWLGIPVKWSHISAAQVIVEAGLDSFQVDPSQGTHFFQNLTSLGVCYLTINAFRGDGIYRQEVLDSLPAVQETEHVRHVRLPAPMTIKVDGCKKEAVVTGGMLRK